MSDINVIVSPSPSRNIILGTQNVVFQPLDYRQGVVDLASGVSGIDFSFSTPFVSDPVFGGEVIYNGLLANDGYGYHVYNLNRSGCKVSFSDDLHTTGYQFQFYATAN